MADRKDASSSQDSREPEADDAQASGQDNEAASIEKAGPGSEVLATLDNDAAAPTPALPSDLGTSTFADYDAPYPSPLDYRDYTFSLEYRHRMYWIYFATAAAFLIGGVGATVGAFLMLQPENRHPLVGSVVIVASILLAPMLFLGIILLRDRKRGDRESERRISMMRGVAQEADERTINQQLLSQYHELTKRQASSSYRISQVAITVGFLILGAGAVVAINAPEATSKLVVGGLAALGSAFSAYIGSTFIRTYNRALAQMNFYYAQPLVQSYILQAERLSSRVSKARKDIVLEHIIDQTLSGASVAAHLITPVGTQNEYSGRRSRARNSAPMANGSTNDGIPTTSG